MQACQDKLGLGIRVNGERIEGVNLQNAREIIEEKLSGLIA